MRLKFLPGLVVLGLFAGAIGNGAWGGPSDDTTRKVALAAAASKHNHARAAAAATSGASTKTATKPPSTTTAAGASGKVPSAAMSPAAKPAGKSTLASYKKKQASVKKKKSNLVTQAQREAAAKQAIAKGMKVLKPTPENLSAAKQALKAKKAGKQVGKGNLKASALGTSSVNAAAAGALAAGQTPHYFGPYANYANSPLRLPDALVTINAVAGDPGTGATAAAVVDGSGAVTAINVTAGGSGYATTPDVVISAATGSGSGASATAVIDANGVVTGITVVSGGSGYVTPGIQKFVNTLAGVGEAGANDLGEYIPVGQPDTTTYPGSDYYEIAVVEYEQKMHRDLPATKLRGYVQLSTSVVPGKHVALTNLDGTPITLPNGDQAYGVDGPHYLGPIIGATKDKPTRILFRNLLPTGTKGDLFLPVDTTVMGSGMGPNMTDANGQMMAEPDPRNPMCGESPKPAGCYTENRATLHLHGGITPWISDGTPHQWITPAGETTDYPKGVSVRNVPDMPDPGPGAQTFFYTNQQSARLMFYHDHAWGITRLNVYAGEAAGYVITDAAEQKLVTDGVIPGAADTLPLIIQDKTFVPSAEQLALTDPTWDSAKWGGMGQLWFPHVYMTIQNPGDTGGGNPFGRWAYGPWFWPPTGGIAHGPIANPYYDPTCDAEISWCEPSTIPGTPNNSMGMEAFNDTPVVNGTVYPTLTVDPKTYRLRILNAASDRSFNLQWYQADATGTEVALNAAEVAAAQTDPDIFPRPDTALSPEGPKFVQIGTEGGFLPTPVTVPNQPITWVTNPGAFNVGNVDKHALLVAPAERADTIVDFSAYAGKTLILYNDAPAAFPARDARYDYYTGRADLTSTGGTPAIVPGYGPNIRTVMQVKVSANPAAPAFDLAKLNTAFAHHTDPATGANAGVFETAQPPIIVGQGAYNTALGSAFRNAAPRDGFVRITENTFTFNTLLGQDAASTLTMPLQPKAIQDEQGEAFDPDYGRMSGLLGLETPNAQAGQQQNLILYPYVNPSSENVNGLTDAWTPIATANDGTQIWKITHNGVDTHPIHFHLFDVQVINRVGWDGAIRKPDANELGWKDTVRISPLEDTIVALRPQIPKSPFGLVDSIRPLNPMTPIGSTAMFRNVDANAQPINPPITNQVVNFGWEYVWHCHILSHEEMDMMRPIVLNVGRQLPAAPTVTLDPATAGKITWTDGTPVTPNLGTNWGNPANEVGYRIERAPMADGTIGTWAPVGTALANQTGFTDPNPATGDVVYRVIAWNAAGDAVSQPGVPAVVPAAPTNLTATAGAAGATTGTVGLAWTGSNWATGYTIERATDAAFTTGVTTVATGVTATTYADTTAPVGGDLWYRIAATNPTGTSGWSNTATVTLALPVTAPTNVTATASTSWPLTVTVAWTADPNATGAVIQRSTDPAFGTSTSFTVNGPDPSFIDITVAPSTAYYYRVQSTGAGSPSTWSTPNAGVTTPATPLTQVTGLAAKAAPVAPAATVLTWNGQPWAAGYEVQRATNTAFTAGLTTFTTGLPTLNDTTAARGTRYYYRARATQPGVNGAWSARVTFTPAWPPRANSLAGTATATGPGQASVKLTWTQTATPITVGGFIIERATNSTFTQNLVVVSSTVPAADRTYTDTGLARNTRYFYRIRTFNSYGFQSNSWRGTNVRTPV